MKEWRLPLATLLVAGLLVAAVGPLMAQAKVNMDKIMSSEDQRRTGVWRLSRAERDALEIWLLRWKSTASGDPTDEQQLFIDWSARVAEDKVRDGKKHPTSSTEGSNQESASGTSRPQDPSGEGYGEAPREYRGRGYRLPWHDANP